ncbi:MAG: sulfatase [Halobacteriota archaeon]|uniref:sulfatase n=1 Tax=Natronomonas sp. TaxID=2184060 RepID=UPI00397694AB
MIKNVLYITIDSIRADRVGYLGYDGGTTPTIDRLAADGTTFEHGVANGIPTYYSFKSLLGGVHALSHGRSIGLPETTRSIAAVFSDAGYATAGFNAQNPWLTPEYGYDRGFDTLEDFMGGSDTDSGGLTHRALMLAQRSVAFSETLTDTLGQLARIAYAVVGSQPITQAEPLTDAAIEWLEAHDRESDRPFFLWVHYMDPHYPWMPPKEYLRGEGEALSRIDVGRIWHTVAYQYQRENATIDDRMLRQIDQLYDAELRRMDASIGRLLETAEATVDDELLVALAGDHGTELNDHGGFSHGPRKLYREVTQVPLLFYGSGVPSATREVGALVDVPQTLTRHSGAIDAPVETYEGIDLFEGARDGVSTEVVYDVDYVLGKNTDNGLLRAQTSPPWKLIRNEETGSVELYDLDDDPHERTNRADDRPELVSELTGTLDAHRETIERRTRTIEEKRRIGRAVSELKAAGTI